MCGVLDLVQKKECIDYNKYIKSIPNLHPQAAARILYGLFLIINQSLAPTGVALLIKRRIRSSEYLDCFKSNFPLPSD